MAAVAVFLVWGADYYTVFDDEAFSTQRYVLPLGELVRGLWNGVEPDPPLYYVLQHAWVSLVGVKPLALRGLSIFFFLLSLPVIRAAGEAWFDARTARWAVVLCGLNPLHLFFGFAARWYSLMFLCVAWLLLATARLVRPGGPPHRAHGDAFRPRSWLAKLPLAISPVHSAMAAWVLAAAAVCYTNYFGVAIVLFIWLWGCIVAVPSRGAWVRMLAGWLVLYAAWIAPFMRQLASFPRSSHDAMAYVATAARTGVALLAGNLAGPQAWYVWVPLGVFVVATLALMLRDTERIAPLAWVAVCAVAAGVASLTMIDKYVMTFSAAVWLLVAAVLAVPRPGIWRHVRTAALGGLALGWGGCGINWVLEDGWGSLRWLDPFRTVVREHLYDPLLVASHPSVRYYYGILDPQHWHGRTTPRDWQARAAAVLQPDEALARFTGSGDDPEELTLIQTSAITADEARWWYLIDYLRREQSVGKQQQYLEDTNAALKDRLDPSYKHPPFRITVTKAYRRGVHFVP